MTTFLNDTLCRSFQFQFQFRFSFTFFIFFVTVTVFQKETKKRSKRSNQKEVGAKESIRKEKREERGGEQGVFGVVVFGVGGLNCFWVFGVLLL